MKDVQIKVYEFDELPEALRQKLKQNTYQELVDVNFEVFSDAVVEQLMNKYGVEGVFGYSLGYCQGDGLHFNTAQLLTDKTVELLKKEIPAEHHKVLDYIVSYGVVIPTRSSVIHYEYASRRDVNFSAIEDMAEDISEHFNITMNEAQQILNAIQTEITDLYMLICAEYEQEGYQQYNVSDDTVLENCRRFYYYGDGRVYGEIEEV